MEQLQLLKLCLKRNRLVVKWRHLVVTFSVEEFSSIAQLVNRVSKVHKHHWKDREERETDKENFSNTIMS